MSDDDWFERALAEGADDDADAADGEGGAEDGRDDEVSRADADAEGSADAGRGEGSAPFGDFATAFRNAPDPDVAEGGSADAGRTGGGAGGEAFDAGAFGGESTAFDEEAEFESDIERISIGIEGLEEMILGGVPRRSMIAVIGSAGTGKTTFGLQFLHHGLDAGERAVYITLEESRQSVIEAADEKDLGFTEYVDEERLAVVDFDPVGIANSLSSVSSELPDLIEEFGATRLVLDSVSLLEMMYDDPAKRRSEVFEFARSLKQAGVTTMVTSEANPDNAYASRYGVIEYLADAVFVLQYVRPTDFRETRLAVEILKIRNANHSRETKPYDITDDGISVYRQANIF